MTEDEAVKASHLDVSVYVKFMKSRDYDMLVS